MQLHRNDALLKRRLRISVVYFVASLAFLLGGFIASTRIDDLPMQYAVSLSTLGVGMTLWWQNKVYLARWGPKSLQDGPIARAMKGVDARYHLFAFAAPRLPDYLITGPMGVIAVLPKAVTGSVTCSDGRWSHDDQRSGLTRFLTIMSPRPSLGNPDGEVQEASQQVKRFLAGRLGQEAAAQIPVEAVLTLTDPNVKLNVQGCTTPVLFLRTLRNHVRRAPRVLSPAQLDQLVTALASP